MQSPDTTTDFNPFDFVPRPNKINEKEYAYWMAAMEDLIYNPTPTLVHLDGVPHVFGNKSFQNFFGERFAQLNLDRLFELIREGNNFTAAELIQQVWNGEIFENLNIDLTEGEVDGIKCNLIPVRLGNRVVGYKFQILNAALILEAELRREREINKIIRLLIAGLAHDARTHITIINTSAYLIIKNRDNISKILEKANQIEENARLLTQLIDLANSDLIATGTIENPMELISVKSVTEDIISQCRNLVTEINLRGFNVSLELDFGDLLDNLEIFTNKSGYTRILLNLIGNSIKYSRKDFQNNVKVRLQITDNQLEIQIEDNGIGIPDAFAEVAFTEYARADNAKVTAQGTGVGLMIVKMFIDSLRGTVSYQSTENLGTLFTITLPLNLQKVAGGFMILDES